MIWSTLKLAFSEIGRNLMRSSLTILGIVIGVAAVISMVTLGGGATTQITNEITSLGSNLLVLQPGTMGGPGGIRADAKLFKIADADAIKKEVAGAFAVTPVSTSATVAIYGNENWQTVIRGVENDYFIIREWDVVAGREFTAAELSSGRLSCILGDRVAKELFGFQNPLGAKIRVENVSCLVIGVMEEKGESTFGMDQDDFILMPINTLHRRILGSTDVGSIYISAKTAEISPQVQRDIIELMRQRRNIRTGDEEDFELSDMAQVASTVESTSGILTAFLAAIAAISLLVGGIGIMNIMLVSVTERTREIGIRLAIGALGWEVLLQFLIEAIILSLFGGLIGIALGLALAAFVAPILGVPFLFDFNIIVISFLFSGAVGVVFGFFPARRAALMDPINALRYE
ncbi:ABC transporter permease [Gracilimonas tropica]|uniref:ABC transporter permease n=1 Tax=Gracilimonas tropica TaxID=454600 RepID=UPI00036955C3|nr:ABC transporter permease [Gracilimonas tropica]